MQKETTAISRLGRVLYWLCTGLGALIALLYLAYGSLGTTGNLIAAVIGFGIPFLIGRAIRYVLAGDWVL
jgi:hypothetical protein